jgi:AcrR family transcriptional regulator
MQEIARRAGAQKVMFYRTFPSRLALMEAIMAEAEAIITSVYSRPWRGYGSRARDLYAVAAEDRALFVAALRTLRLLPELEEARRRILRIMRSDAHSLLPAGSCPPADFEARAARAMRTLSSLFLDTLLAWLEDRDGLSEERRIIWWTNVMLEWAKVTRIVYELEGPFEEHAGRLSSPPGSGAPG